jgi:hypothetical protein
MMTLISSTKSAFFRAPIARAALAAFLMLTLMSVLWVDLNHNHFQEIQSSGECEICLKSGSSDDVISEPPSIVSETSSPVQEALLPFDFEGSTFVKPSARAPPIA